MKKKTNIFVVILSIIGLICAAVCLFVMFKDRIQESSLYQKLFGDDDDLDIDFSDDEFMDDENIETVETKETDSAEEAVEEEEEAPAPKVRRGYIPLKFPAKESA